MRAARRPLGIKKDDDESMATIYTESGNARRKALVDYSFAILKN
jgi:hypothetical protein